MQVRWPDEHAASAGGSHYGAAVDSKLIRELLTASAHDSISFRSRSVQAAHGSSLLNFGTKSLFFCP